MTERHPQNGPKASRRHPPHLWWRCRLGIDVLEDHAHTLPDVGLLLRPLRHATALERAVKHDGQFDVAVFDGLEEG